MSKRARTDAGYSTANRRAVAASIAIRKKFPRDLWGVAHLQRGTVQNLADYGADFRSANTDQRLRRKLQGYYGRGSYWSDALGELKGAGMSYFRGGQAGLARHVGDRILHSRPLKKFSRWMGMGAYTDNGPVHNQLVNPGSHPFQNHSASMHSVAGEEGSVIIENKEFIQDVLSPTGVAAFTTMFTSAVNPGLGAVFPWLSQIAQFYDEYQFEQLVFEFRSLVTEGNAAAGGSVIMACQYNVLNNTFTNKQTMENYDYAVSGKVTESMTLGVECHPDKRNFEQLFVRTGAVPVNTDQKTYDVGLLQIAVAGTPSTATALGLGELWVHYRVKLSKTKLLGGNLVSMSGGSANSALYFNVPTSVTATYAACLWDINGGTSGTFSVPSSLFASANVETVACIDNTTGITVVNTVGTSQSVAFQFPLNCNPVGNMYFQVQFSSSYSQPTTAVTVNVPSWTGSLNNCVFVGDFRSTSVVNVSDNQNVLYAIYKTVAPGAFSLTVGNLGLSAGSQSGQRRSLCRIMQLPYNFPISANIM